MLWTVSEPNENTLRNAFGVEFPWAQAELTASGATLKDVGVRYKGNYTFMATAQSLKKSMKIDFNRFVDGQKFDGLTMLNLHCGVSDPFMTREALSCVFFRDAGVPAARTVFVELLLTVPDKYDKELLPLLESRFKQVCIYSLGFGSLAGNLAGGWYS